MAEGSAGKLRRAEPEAAGVAREIMGRGLWVVAQREGAAEVDLSGDACPACGCTLPLVDGACADCGLQLEVA